MTLNEIRRLVEGSSLRDWHKYEEATAVLVEDIDVSLDWCVTINPSFTESWHKTLPDPHASSVCVALRHNGSPVDTWTFVIVDGGRYLVPLPRPDSAGVYEVESQMMLLGNLMFELYGSGGTGKTLTDILKTCGVNIV